MRDFIRSIIIFCTMCTFIVKPAFASTGEFEGYMQDLREKIHKTWTPPELMLSGHAKVMFKVDSNGNVIDAQITESSNNRIYDESTLEALKQASPFGHFPESSTRTSITIMYNFDMSLVKTDRMREYVENSDRYFYSHNNELALKYINLAIEDFQGEAGAYFLYAKRSKIKKEMGDEIGAKSDFDECKRLKTAFDRKRIYNAKLNAEMAQTAFSYFYLAHAYDIAEDYSKAIDAINIAISKTELNNSYKRYRQELVQKSNGE